MPIFDLKKQKVIQINSDINHFKNEAELRDFFASNLEELLGMKFLAKEYPTTDGRIDTLALDEASSPVIIEYKWGQDNAIVVQGLFYYDWLKKNKKHFDLLVADKLGKNIKVKWDNPRIVLVSQGFDNRTLVAVQQVSNIELIKYIPYKNDILYLENVYSPKTIKTFKERPIEDDKETIYDLSYHLGKSDEMVKKMFYRLQERIKLLPSVEEMVDQRMGITYRTSRSFTRFEFGKSYIDILLRDPKYIDPKNFVIDISSNKWGYKGRVKIKSDADIDYVFNLIEQSYQSTL
jgi:predicted transport protein